MFGDLEWFVLWGLDDLGLWGGFVIDGGKMEYGVYDEGVELGVIGWMEVLGVGG